MFLAILGYIIGEGVCVRNNCLLQKSITLIYHRIYPFHKIVFDKTSAISYIGDLTVI